MNKRTVVLLSICAFFILALFGRQIIAPPTADYLAENVRRITVNNVGLTIPKEFFHELSIPANYSDETTVLLVAELPGITRLTKPDVADYYKEEKMRYTRVKISSLLNDDGTRRKTLAERLAARKHFSNATKQADDVHGLHYLIRPPNVQMDRKEILYGGSDGDLRTLLYCHPDPSYGPQPGCEMDSLYNGLIVNVDFRRRDWLAEWQIIKENTIKRLDEFHAAYLKFQEPQKGE